MSYNRDTEVTLTGTFRDLVLDALADPDAVTLYVLNPAGTVSTYTLAASEVTRDSLGVYSKDVTLDASGAWYYRFKGSGAVTVADWKRIDVIDDPLD
jgi:hypothetical protein